MDRGPELRDAVIDPLHDGLRAEIGVADQLDARMAAMHETLLFGLDIIGHLANRAAGEQFGDHRGAKRTGAAGNNNVTLAKISHFALPDPALSEIRAAAVDLPIAIARRLGTFRTADFALARRRSRGRCRRGFR